MMIMTHPINICWEGHLHRELTSCLQGIPDGLLPARFDFMDDTMHACQSMHAMMVQLVRARPLTAGHHDFAEDDC